MEIRDKDGLARVRLYNFRSIYNDEPIFVDLLVEILLPNVSAKEAITIERSDLEDFLQNLKRLNANLKQVFYFQHIDEQLQIKFEPLVTGNINVTGFLKDKQYVNELKFSFEMPPSELINLIRETKDTLDVLV